MVIPENICGNCYHDKETADTCNRPDCETTKVTSMSDQELFDYMANEHGVTLLESDMVEIKRICESSGSPGGYIAMWEAYGPARICLTFDNESSVGPTEINDVAGPLLVVGGSTPEESLANAKRIADLLNRHGLKHHNTGGNAQ